MFFRGLSSFLQLLINVFGGSISFVVNVFPSSPFTILATDSDISILLSKINFFIPVYDFVSLLESWLVAVSAYYVYSVWARWIKAID